MEPSVGGKLTRSPLQDLDAALKTACEQLIAHSSLTLTAPLRLFLDRCTAYLSSPAAKAGELVAQEWAGAEEVLRLHATFQEELKSAPAAVVERMRLYLVDDKTVGVLIPPLWVRRRSRFLSHRSRSLMVWFPSARRTTLSTRTRPSTIVSRVSFVDGFDDKLTLCAAGTG